MGLGPSRHVGDEAPAIRYLRRRPTYQDVGRHHAGLRPNPRMQPSAGAGASLRSGAARLERATALEFVGGADMRARSWCASP